MIVKTMSDSEILKELKSIQDVLISRFSGYRKKFGKQLKSNVYKHNDVLGVGEYMINWNKVIVCFQKLVYSDKPSDLSVSFIVVTKDNGAFLPFRDEQGNFAFYYITNHSIDRMWQRMGLTIKDFYVNEFAKKAGGTHCLMEYDGYGYDDSTYIMAIGRCFFIVRTDDYKIIVKTTLDGDRIHPDQMKLYLDSKRGAEQFAEKVYRRRNATRLKGTGAKKRSNVVRAICA